MKSEFQRYGLSRFRLLVGLLESLGGLGLLIGLLWPPLTLVSATGLCLLMLLGLGVRFRLRDPWPQLLPAALLLLINLSIILLFFSLKEVAT